MEVVKRGALILCHTSERGRQGPSTDHPRDGGGRWRSNSEESCWESHFEYDGSEVLEKDCAPRVKPLDIYVEACSVPWKSIIADWKIHAPR